MFGTYFYTKGDGKVTCNLCKKDLVYRNGTSNLRDHLNRIHPNDYKQGRSWVFIDGGAYYKLLTIT